MQTNLSTQPLYRQVRDAIIASLKSGKYVVDQALPSEQRLASEYGVSQGTVRKAIDDLVAQNILYRHQGRGTFIRRHTESFSLFRFFNLVRPDGSSPLPGSKNLTIRREAASAEVALKLGLVPGQPVVRLTRVRVIDEQPAIFEIIYLDNAWFNNYEEIELPNTLYQLYADHFGVNVTRAEEQVGLTLLNKTQAEALSVSDRTPVLQIDRIAYELDDLPAEYRISLCRNDLLRYRSQLG